METRRFFDYGATGASDTGGKLAFLADRPPSDWEKITERADVRRFSRGDTIIAAGDRDQALYIQVAGSVGVFLPGADEPFTVIDAPSVLGEVAFLDGGPRTATLVAVEDCELLRLSMQAYEVLAAHDPVLGRAILLDLGRILAARLRNANELLGGE